MGDVKHGNVKPRPLGEVTVDSVYFDSSPAVYLEKGGSLVFGDGIRRLRVRPMTTSGLRADNRGTSKPLYRKTPTAHLPGVCGTPAMALITQLVSPPSRTISIPQPRNTTNRCSLLRINTAPVGSEDATLMNDPCPSPASSMESGLGDTSCPDGKASKVTFNWTEYRRQLNNVRRKEEYTRQISEMSTCNAVDMSDPASRDARGRHVPILSRVRQQEWEYKDLVARADKVLQQKKTLPSVFISKQKRPGSLIKDTHVFSKTLKSRSSAHVGEIDDVLVGRSIDLCYGDSQDDLVSEKASVGSSGWNRYIDLSKRGSSEIVSSRGIPATPVPNVLQSERSYLRGRRRQKVVTIQGKSLPKLYMGRPGRQCGTPACYPSRSETRNPHDARLLKDINDKCDIIQKRISSSLSVTDRSWPQQGYIRTNQTDPITGSNNQHGRQPVQVVYKSFQRMREYKPEVRTRHGDTKVTDGNNVNTCGQSEEILNDDVRCQRMCNQNEEYLDAEGNGVCGTCEEEYLHGEVKVDQNKAYFGGDLKARRDNDEECEGNDEYVYDGVKICHDRSEQHEDYSDDKVNVCDDTGDQNEQYIYDEVNEEYFDHDVKGSSYDGVEDNNDDLVNNRDENKADENNNQMAIRTFRLTELDDDTDSTDSDSEDGQRYRLLPDTGEADVKSLAPVKLSDPTRQRTGTAKFQGPSSRVSEDESGSQFHIVNGEASISRKEVYKILTALDKDVYVDFEHRKYRRSGTLSSIANSDNPRVHFLKIKVSENN